MRLGKKTSRAISIALLAAMASTSLPQVDVLAAVKKRNVLIRIIYR